MWSSTRRTARVSRDSDDALVAGGDRRPRGLTRDGLGRARRGELPQAPARDHGPARPQRVHVVLRHGARDDAAGAAGAAGRDPRHPVLRQRLRREQALRRARHAGHPAGMAIPGGGPRAWPRDAILPFQACDQSPDGALARAGRRHRNPTRSTRRHTSSRCSSGTARASRARRSSCWRSGAYDQNDRRFIGALRRSLAEPRHAVARAMGHGHRSVPTRSSRGTTTCWTAT